MAHSDMQATYMYMQYWDKDIEDINSLMQNCMHHLTVV